MRLRSGFPLLLCGLAAGIHPGGLGAQVSYGIPRVDHRLLPETEIRRDTYATAGAAMRTHWKEGLIIGAAAGGVLGAVLANAYCQLSESTHPHCTRTAILGGIAGAVTLGIPGALIGSLFPKD